MKAEDLRFTEAVSQDPIYGFPLLGPYRLMVVSVTSISSLFKDMRKVIDPKKMDVILARFGYHIGMTTAMAVSERYDFDSDEEWFKAGSYFRNYSGIVQEVIEAIEMNKDENSFRFSGTWHGAFDLNTASISKNADKTLPTCNLLSALSSGYASAVFGSEVLVKEVQCRSQGYEFCRFEGRSAREWGISLEEIRAYFDLSPFEEEVANLRKKLMEAQQDLDKQTTEINRLKALMFKPGLDNELIYRSKSMSELLELAKKAAPTDSTILIQGESGTGKEVIARYLHRHSKRAKKPFVDISCGALPANLLESELFGHVKGAFTGADKNHTGLLVEASDGTVFLDEVGELPMDLQVKLLRVIQQREVRPVGGTRNVRIKARIIAATNRDLRQMVDRGSFREDLYYRLAVFPLQLTPLRERTPDILPLARHFLKSLKKQHFGFSPEVMRIMENYGWPGNVRELENCVEYSVILSGENQILTEHLPASLMSAASDPLLDITNDLPTYDELEKRYTSLVLERTGGNRKKAANILGTSATTLWRRLKKDSPPQSKN